MTSLQEITCGVPHVSILGFLLFLLYKNDIFNVSNIITPVIFQDDANLFYSNKNIKTVFNKMNVQLKHITEWLKTKKLSINIDRANFILFHKQQDKINTPLKLPTLIVNEVTLKQVISTKVLGVHIDKNLNWMQHIALTKNKISQQLGTLSEAKPYLNRK